MFEQRRKQVQDKVNVLVEKANKLYNFTLPPIQVRFDLRGRAAGIAGRKWGTYYMRFNQQMMLNEGWDHLFNDTVPHELAHIVCFYNPQLGRNHDLGWKRVCRALGGNGERCHSEEVEYAHGTIYYTTTSGHVVPVSRQRHANIQRGRSYTFRDGKGSLNNQCQYSLRKPTEQAKPQPVVAPTKPVAPPTSVLQLTTTQMKGTGSKADHVRAKIRDCKRNGQGMDVAIAWAMTALGMSRSLAKTYVQNNWQSVV